MMAIDIRGCDWRIKRTTQGCESVVKGQRNGLVYEIERQEHVTIWSEDDELIGYIHWSPCDEEGGGGAGCDIRINGKLSWGAIRAVGELVEDLASRWESDTQPVTEPGPATGADEPSLRPRDFTGDSREAVE